MSKSLQRMFGVLPTEYPELSPRVKQLGFSVQLREGRKTTPANDSKAAARSILATTANAFITRRYFGGNSFTDQDPFEDPQIDI